MKKVIILLSLLIVACGPTKRERQIINEKVNSARYKPGDEVYLKPDSQKAVVNAVEYRRSCFCEDTGLIYKLVIPNDFDKSVPDHLVY